MPFMNTEVRGIFGAVAADTRFPGRGRVELISENVSADNAVTYSRIDVWPRKSQSTTQRWSRGAALIARGIGEKRKEMYFIPGAILLGTNEV